jgi:hypothetical protein
LATIFGGESSATTNNLPPTQSNPKNDIMSLFNTGPTATSNSTQNTPAANPLDSLILTTSPPKSNSTNDIVNLFGSPSTNQISSAQSANPLDNLMGGTATTTPPSSGSIGMNTSGISTNFTCN